MKFRNVPLSYIKEEEALRNDLEDFSLTTDIQENELDKPLIVERIGINQFVLVEGYRRFRALKYLNIPFVMCQVDTLTSPDSRILKRLRTELKTKKRTSYEIERMITFLLDSGYHEDEIAKQCTVQKKTIKKYMSGKSINPDWKTRGEQTGAARHGLTEISNLKNIHQDNKSYVGDMYVERKINASTIGNIKKITKLDQFDELSKEKQKECIDEMIDKNHSIDMAVKDSVFTKALKYKYSPIMHKHVFEGLLYLLDKIDDMAHSNLVDYLTSAQKKTLQQKLISLSQKLDLPLNWSDYSSKPANSVDKHKKFQDNVQMLHIDDTPESQSDTTGPLQ